MVKHKNKYAWYLLILLLFSLTQFPLVVASDWYRGDLHMHTGYSTLAGYDHNPDTDADDCQSEWLDPSGFNVSELRTLAISNDVDWLTITDHSYCLNQTEWNTVKTDCDDDSDGTFFCVADEELSVSSVCTVPPNVGGHLGVHFLDEFINNTFYATVPPLIWYPKSPTSRNTFDYINNNDGLSIIHHPNALLWDWTCKNSIDSGTGVEIWNGAWGGESLDSSALQWWVSLLLKGRKNYAFGGSDSHEEFGTTVFTYAYMDGFSADSLKNALKTGRATISNNGWLDLSIGSVHMGGEALVKSEFIFPIRIDYSIDNDCEFELIKGDIKDEEEDIDTRSLTAGTGYFFVSDSMDENTYYRAECVNSGGSKRIYSNPIWTTAYQTLTVSNNGNANMILYRRSAL
jgi:hypothetical protein